MRIEEVHACNPRDLGVIIWNIINPHSLLPIPNTKKRNKNNWELNHATFLSHGLQPGVNISHATSVVSSWFSQYTINLVVSRRVNLENKSLLVAICTSNFRWNGARSKYRSLVASFETGQTKPLYFDRAPFQRTKGPAWSFLLLFEVIWRLTFVPFENRYDQRRRILKTKINSSYRLKNLHLWKHFWMNVRVNHYNPVCYQPPLKQQKKVTSEGGVRKKTNKTQGHTWPLPCQKQQDMVRKGGIAVRRGRWDSCW